MQLSNARRGMTKIEGLVVLAIVSIFILLLVQGCGAMLGGREKVYGTVKRVYEMSSSESSKHMIAVTLDTGETETFENEDSLYYGKHNSTTLQDNLNVGSRYRFDVCGTRNEMFSWYRNVIGAESAPKKEGK